jgi:hypothetical protein
MNVVLKIVRFVMASKPAQWALIALAMLGVIKARDIQQQREGRDEERERQFKTDVDAAREIHRRAARVERMPVDPDDTRGYRD